jgi:hypothetical protein
MDRTRGHYFLEIRGLAREQGSIPCIRHYKKREELVPFYVRNYVRWPIDFSSQYTHFMDYAAEFYLSLGLAIQPIQVIVLTLTNQIWCKGSHTGSFSDLSV